jgi:flavodoxin
MDNRKVLSVYFTRVGNSDFDKDINAVSGASLMLDGETLIGNSQLLAEMIRDAVDGDIVAIQTKKKYPSSYDDTVSEARTELNKEELPELAGDKIPDWESYDVIFLTYPVWWGTIPMAVRSFLSEYDFSGKKAIPVAAHGGSKFGNSLQDLSRYCNGEVLAESGLEVYCDDVPFMREMITEWLKRVPV